MVRFSGKFAFVFVFILFASAVTAQVLMVRCDDGSSKEFLSSPEKINLSTISSSFDRNVDTIVMVHGFMTNFEDCKGSYTTTVNSLRPIIGRRNYIGFHWPAKVLWFGTGVENANKTGAYLVHVLNEITKWYGGNGRKIHMLTHSLGGRVLLNTLEQNSARYVCWGTCYMMASAVHNDAFQSAFPGTNELPEKIYVFHSERDGVLKYIYSLYYFLFGNGDRSIHASPEIQKFMELTFEEQIAYIQNLDESMQRGCADISSELDQQLVFAIEEGRSAMGLYGACCTPKVENTNLSDVVSSHTYWENTEAIRRIAGTM